MSEGIEVAVVHGIKISYDAEKKLFNARVGGKEIRKSSQRDLEKVISKFVRGTERVKALILDFGWRTVQVIPIEVVGIRGSKVQYKKGDWMESEDAGKVYVQDEAVLAQATALQKEYDAWTKRWEALLKKAKQVDPASLK